MPNDLVMYYLFRLVCYLYIPINYFIIKHPELLETNSIRIGIEECRYDIGEISMDQLFQLVICPEVPIDKEKRLKFNYVDYHSLLCTLITLHSLKEELQKEPLYSEEFKLLLSENSDELYDILIPEILDEYEKQDHHLSPEQLEDVIANVI